MRRVCAYSCAFALVLLAPSVRADSTGQAVTLQADGCSSSGSRCADPVGAGFSQTGALPVAYQWRATRRAVLTTPGSTTDRARYGGEAGDRAFGVSDPASREAPPTTPEPSAALCFVAGIGIAGWRFRARRRV
jgi:hypothetical protein